MFVENAYYLPGSFTIKFFNGMVAQGQCKQWKQAQTETENYLNHAAPL